MGAGQGSQIFRATETEVVNGITRLEAAPKTKAHERRIITPILRAPGTGAAKAIAFRNFAPARFTSGQRGVEVGNPFPHQAM